MLVTPPSVPAYSLSQEQVEANFLEFVAPASEQRFWRKDVVVIGDPAEPESRVRKFILYRSQAATSCKEDATKGKRIHFNPVESRWSCTKLVRNNFLIDQVPSRILKVPQGAAEELQLEAACDVESDGDLAEGAPLSVEALSYARVPARSLSQRMRLGQHGVQFYDKIFQQALTDSQKQPVWKRLVVASWGLGGGDALEAVLGRMKVASACGPQVALIDPDATPLRFVGVDRQEARSSFAASRLRFLVRSSLSSGDADVKGNSVLAKRKLLDANRDVAQQAINANWEEVARTMVYLKLREDDGGSVRYVEDLPALPDFCAHHDLDESVVAEAWAKLPAGMSRASLGSEGPPAKRRRLPWSRGALEADLPQPGPELASGGSAPVESPGEASGGASGGEGVVLTNAEDVGYILRLAVAGYKGLSIEAVQSLQLPSRATLWANGCGELAVARRAPCDLEWRLSAAQWVVFLRGTDSDPTPGQPRFAVSVDEVLKWVEENKNPPGKNVDLSGCLHGHTASRSAIGKWTVRRSAGESLYFSPEKGRREEAVMMAYDEKAWKVKLCWVVQWDEERWKVVPCAVSLVLVSARKFDVGFATLADA